MDLGSVLESELGQEVEIRCVKGMYRLKLVSSRSTSVFKGLTPTSKLAIYDQLISS